jgi:hypothetical protein
MALSDDKEVKGFAGKVSSALKADVILYNGGIRLGSDIRLTNLCRGRKRNPNVLLILVTEGGDANTAFRLARCLHRNYQKFICFIAGYCKSAGTLLALGAHELVFSDNGEIGPLDVQMWKRDELGETESGLTVMASLAALHEKAFSAFEHFLIEIKTKSENVVTLRTATDVAATLTKGLFSPIFGQIDPMHVGEAGRAMAVAQAYGARLQLQSQNFSMDSLDELISEYPSHDFAIDREEAERLFSNVRSPGDAEQSLADALKTFSMVPQKGRGRAIIEFLSEEPQGDGNENGGDSNSGTGEVQPGNA